ncbi:MAG: DNA repair protein RadA [candidate division NC10 bacterium]|nr:DNA repair protein RadA [candidate division NC10 bacterium]MBI4390876.1 DNA repair protein RadA [candidate division NC10 bacterium]
MAKERTAFVCQQCGYQTVRWMGKCPDCGTWASLLEERAATRGAAGRPGASGGPAPRPITAVPTDGTLRIPLGLAEADRALGGGLTPGSVLILGGEPGIGKSTLLLQAAAAAVRGGRRVLYVSAEESEGQIRSRAERLGALAEGLLLLPETRLEAILGQAEATRPDFLILDSVQMVSSGDLQSGPGTISQVREAAAALQRAAKQTGMSVLLIGHVTKDGSLAGPKSLEHLVDTVLSFEGDQGHPYRVLRVLKHRFGSTEEIGLFEMTDAGLEEVGNPSGRLLRERPAQAPGSAVLAALEGSRPMLLEVQALVAPAGLGAARRVAGGVDRERLALLLAVLERHVGLALGASDVYVNVAGGLRVTEPAADLAVVAAVLSSAQGRPVDPHLVCCGEVGLAGEVRSVRQVPRRLAEAARLGFTRALLPAADAGAAAPPGLALEGLRRVGALPEALFAGK